MKISVCIPMYNENRVIAKTASRLSSYMSEHFDDYEIIFCNDGSTDGCDETVKALDLPHVRVIGYPQNRGKGHAVRTAMLEATGDIRIFTDSDLAYGTDVIEAIVKAFEQNQAGGELPCLEIDAGEGILNAFVNIGFCASKGEARRLIKQGGLKLNDKTISDENYCLGACDIVDGQAKIALGKKKIGIIKLR